MKVKSEFFTDTDRENFDQIFGEPDYQEWSDDYDRRASHNSDNSNQCPIKTKSTEGADKQVRELQVPELRGYSGGSKTAPF